LFRYLLIFLLAHIKGKDQNIGGVHNLSIGVFAITVALAMCVLPYMRCARSTSRKQVEELTGQLAELLEVASKSFCDPQAYGSFRLKMNMRIQNAFTKLMQVEDQLKAAWFEPACRDALLRARLIMFVQHLHWCLRCLHLLMD
jgi:hypothetical protein